MANQRKQSGARHPRSPLPRAQTVREKRKMVPRKPRPPIPAASTPVEGGTNGSAQASRIRRMVTFYTGNYFVQ